MFLCTCLMRESFFIPFLSFKDKNEAFIESDYYYISILSSQVSLIALTGYNTHQGSPFPKTWFEFIVHDAIVSCTEVCHSWIVGRDGKRIRRKIPMKVRCTPCTGVCKQ